MMLKILLADDLEICRKCLAMFLSRQGYHVLEAADGVEALRILKAERPDVAVVDLLMPELDGFEFVREARKDPAISGIPVIFLSASFPAESVKPIAASLGVRHILQKSFFQAPVLEAIKEILRGDGPLEVEVSDQDFRSKHLQVMTEQLTAEFGCLALNMGEFLKSSYQESEIDVQNHFAIVDSGLHVATGMDHSLV